MFLFKNTKSIVKRIGMNMAVYGFASVFILMILAMFLPEIIANYVYVLTVISSFVAIIGAIVSVVCFFIEVVNVTKSYKESDKQPKTMQKCSLCGDSFSKIEMFNNKPYCYACSSYYSSKYNINNGKLVDKESGGVLLKEVILLAKPLHGCRGAIEPTDFIINLFTDKVEIVWGVGWRGGDSHADGAKGIEILEASYFEENTIDDFVTFLNTKHWGKDFVKWFNIRENDKIISLFNPLKSVIDKMINFLSYKNYDIEFANGEMAIVKHSGDPLNHFNKFIAKDDGVYNYVEVHMGGYDEKKRVSCCNFETACFLTLALFISREKLHIQESLILEIKQYANTVIDNSSDYWRGQFIIDELISLITLRGDFMETLSWRSNSYLSKYDCGAMQYYTTVPSPPLADEKGVYGRFNWARYGNDVLITSITNDSIGATIKIPNTIHGYLVKGIAERAFMNRIIYDIYLPDSIEYIGALAIGFNAFPVYNDKDEDRIKKEKPFAHNWPTSTLVDFTYYLHQSPKTQIHGIKSSVAEEYANKHQLPFVSL